jgi:nicotinamide riboside kinase
LTAGVLYFGAMSPNSKIAFIGSHGVGKTTLCFELAAALKRLDLSVDLVKEVARGCPLPINRDTTMDAQNWILHTQVAREIELGSAFDVIVCDRAVLDNYAYMVHAGGRRPEIEPFIRYWMGTYSLLVKVPIVTPPAFDGTRDTSVDFQVGIDNLIDELLDEFQISRTSLPADSREGWVKRVLEAIDLPGDPPQLDLFT